MSSFGRRAACAAAVLGLLLGLPALPFVADAATRNAVLFAPLAGLAALIAGSVYALARWLWRRSVGETALLLFGCLTAAFFAVLVGFLMTFLVTINKGLCGTGGHVSGLGLSVAAVVYTAIGGWAFTRPQRLIWGWPVAVLAGLAASLLVHAVAPGGHGFCET